MLTQSELKKVIHYCPETGIFTRIIKGKKIGKKLHNGYQRIAINKKLHYAHRLAWLYVYGEFPKMLIDHINRVKDDNRIVNLREADYLINRFNRGVDKISSSNTSGITGVSFNKDTKKWRAYIYKNYINIYLGGFETKEQAIQARKNAELT